MMIIANPIDNAIDSQQYSNHKFNPSMALVYWQSDGLRITISWVK